MVTGIKGFAERLNKRLDASGAPDWQNGRQDYVGKLFGVSGTAARKWMMAEGMPDTKRLNEIAHKLNTSVEYLLSGDGEEIKDKTPAYKADRQDIHQWVDQMPENLMQSVRMALMYIEDVGGFKFERKSKKKGQQLLPARRT